MKLAIPRIYLGTMTFAWSQTSSTVDEIVATEMTKKFMQFNSEIGVDVHYIDTARIYAGGKTEPMVGAVLKKIDSSHISVGTKAHPSGSLSAEGMKAQLQASLDAMGISSLGEYYLHQPDTETSLLESLKCADEMVKQGKIQAVGLSNYHCKEVERAFELCKEHGLTPPSIYQGLYNPLNRIVEDELIPLLHKNGCSFVAYNPLAAGLLSGKHQTLGQVQKGRFKDNQNYLPRFYTKENFRALELIRFACDTEGISMVEASLRWLLCHSQLQSNDGLLLGASSLDQIDENLAACKVATQSETPLPPAILKAFDECYLLVKDGAFPYWRSYSSDFPNRGNLDQGASYNAAKAK